MPPTTSRDFQKAAAQRLTTAETLLREKLILDAHTSDTMNLLTFAPSDLDQSVKTSREFLLNTEFDEPSPSIL